MCNTNPKQNDMDRLVNFAVISALGEAEIIFIET